jgi:hypothetical protein
VAPFIRTPPIPGGDGGWRSVQIVWSKQGGKRRLQHVGVAHNAIELAAKTELAREIIAAGPSQGTFDFGADFERGQRVRAVGEPLRSLGSKMTVLWDALEQAYRALGFDLVACDEVFRDLVFARIIEPTSKIDSIRVCAEAGYPTKSYPTIKRRLRVYCAEGFREALAAACAKHAQLGSKTLVLYDVTTLYFETDKADDFRIPGFSKERRLEPQITVGLLTDGAGFPLLVNAFEGNKAETKTMLPTIKDFMAIHGLADVIIVADAGMVSEENRKALEAEGLSFIIGEKIPFRPYELIQWHKNHPGKELPDGQILKQIRTLDEDKKPKQIVYYQWRAARAKRTLHGIDQQVAKARKAVAGDFPIKRNKYVKVSGETRELNAELEEKHRQLAGWKAYITNIPDATADFVINSYHQLFEVEKSFRMSKSDLAARPIFHYTKDSIEAHLTIVFAALAVSRWIEAATGWSIRRFVRTARQYRTTYIQLGNKAVPAQEDLPDELNEALERIKDTKEKKLE